MCFQNGTFSVLPLSSIYQAGLDQSWKAVRSPGTFSTGRCRLSILAKILMPDVHNLKKQTNQIKEEQEWKYSVTTARSIPCSVLTPQKYRSSKKKPPFYASHTPATHPIYHENGCFL